MDHIQTKKGFTIIEVVLVLAIAGLIFLMVFIALPALQSGQRDNARKNDVSIVASAVNTYSSGNRGTMPTTSTLQSFVTNVSDNSDKANVTVVSYSAATVPISDSEIKVVMGAKCGSTAKVGTGTPPSAPQGVQKGTKRQYATITLLEAGGGTSFCQDS